MYQLNAERGGICFKDIQREDLPEILRWYNDTQEFEFATGVDAPISLDKLAESFEGIASSGKDFFAGIYSVENGEMIGFLKGALKEKPEPETGEKSAKKTGGGNEGGFGKDPTCLWGYGGERARGSEGKHEKNINWNVWLSILAIKPAYRNKGYGGKAVELLLDCLKENVGVKEAYLAVVEENFKGRAFWARKGFEEIKRLENHAAPSGRVCNAVIMRRAVQQQLKISATQDLL